MPYTVSLSKCGCGHFDVEHEVVFGEFHEPKGSGRCRVCENCEALTNPNTEALQKEEEQRVESTSFQTQQAQWNMLTAMVNDDEYFKQVLRTVYVNRIEGLQKHADELLKEDKHAELVPVFQKIRETYFEVGRHRLDESIRHKWTRRVAIGLALICEGKAKIFSRVSK